MTKLRQRLAREEGFTLIELLVVIVIIGILLAIAVPSYLGFKDRPTSRRLAADVRAAIPSAEAYYSNQGSYQGMNLTALAAIDQGLKVDSVKVERRLGDVLPAEDRGRQGLLPRPAVQCRSLRERHRGRLRVSAGPASMSRVHIEG